MTRLQLILPQ